MAAKTERKPRADAERNRELLVATAKTAFAESGTKASLEDIARKAGVGIGTLYRHFPTRDALVVAVYRNETAQLEVAAKTLSERHPPIEALRAWMLLFVDYMTAKQGMIGLLDSLAGGTNDLYAKTTDEITRSMNMLAARAEATGEVKIAVDPVDLLRAVSAPVKDSAATKQTIAAAKHMVDIVLAGIRTSTAATKKAPRSRGNMRAR